MWGATRLWYQMTRWTLMVCAIQLLTYVHSNSWSVGCTSQSFQSCEWYNRPTWSWKWKYFAWLNSQDFTRFPNPSAVISSPCFITIFCHFFRSCAQIYGPSGASASDCWRLSLPGRCDQGTSHRTDASWMWRCLRGATEHVSTIFFKPIWDDVLIRLFKNSGWNLEPP